MATEQNIINFSNQTKKIFEQIARDVIGQKEVVRGAVIAMIAGGNVLLEGVPGVGKTRLVRTLGRVFFADTVYSRLDARRRYRHEYHRKGRKGQFGFSV